MSYRMWIKVSDLGEIMANVLSLESPEYPDGPKWILVTPEVQDEIQHRTSSALYKDGRLVNRPHIRVTIDKETITRGEEVATVTFHDAPPGELLVVVNQRRVVLPDGDRTLELTGIARASFKISVIARAYTSESVVLKVEDPA